MNRLRCLRGWLVLAALFIRELLASVHEVALTVLWPARAQRSAIVAIPLDVSGPFGIALLANLITLTPGTTTLHVSEDGSTLYAHVLNANGDTVRAIKDGFERRVIDAVGAVARRPAAEAETRS